MDDLKSTLMSSLRAGKLPARQMDADDLIAFLFPIFNPEYLFNGEPMPDLRYDPTRPIKEQITAFGHRARVRTTEILFGVPPGDDEPDTAWPFERWRAALSEEQAPVGNDRHCRLVHRHAAPIPMPIPHLRGNLHA
jgi:hypothetical protein